MVKTVVLYRIVCLYPSGVRQEKELTLTYYTLLYVLVDRRRNGEGGSKLKSYCESVRKPKCGPLFCGDVRGGCLKQDSSKKTTQPQKFPVFVTEVLSTITEKLWKSSVAFVHC